MLTKKQNMIEAITGGRPERFVNQFEAIQTVPHVIMVNNRKPKRGERDVVDGWGVTNSWDESQPGAFPDHSMGKVVIKDITHWRDFVSMPQVSFSEAEWEPFVAQVEAIDRDEAFVAPIILPGVFEQCHYLGEMANTMAGFYEEPERMRELIAYITEFELKSAEQICDHLKPDAIYHHDDWGSQTSTFMSPDMWAEFFLDPYKEIYGYWRSRGIELIIHHADCYAATLVPYMVELGIDIWQGVLSGNDIPKLIAEYGGKISFMGGIDNGVVDRRDWTHESISAEVKRVCDANGASFFIPNTTTGGKSSAFPGVYDAVSNAIDAYNEDYFSARRQEWKKTR